MSTFSVQEKRCAWVRVVCSSATDAAVLDIAKNVLESMPDRSDPEERLGVIVALNSVLTHRRLTLPAGLMELFVRTVTSDQHERVFDAARGIFARAATNGHRLESIGLVTELKKGVVEQYRAAGGNPKRREMERDLVARKEQLRQLNARIGRAAFSGRSASAETLANKQQLTQQIGTLEAQVAKILRLERQAFRLDVLSRV